MHPNTQNARPPHGAKLTGPHSSQTRPTPQRGAHREQLLHELSEAIKGPGTWSLHHLHCSLPSGVHGRRGQVGDSEYVEMLQLVHGIAGDTARWTHVNHGLGSKLRLGTAARSGMIARGRQEMLLRT